MQAKKVQKPMRDSDVWAEKVWAEYVYIKVWYRKQDAKTSCNNFNSLKWCQEYEQILQDTNL